MRTSILLVDDDPGVLKMLGDYFRMMGCDVVQAQSIEDAFAILETRAVSTVLTDLRLSATGDLGGVEVARFARGKLPRANIFLMSGYFPDDIGLQTRDLGLGGFIEKPFPLSIMHGLIEREHDAA